jgi:glycosyltransferase involved in cell wall biosynthesis
MPSSVCVVIPALNAAPSLPSVIAGIRTHAPSVRIIVVDDGSNDGTAAVARKCADTVLSHGANRGKGAALRTGVQHALHDADVDAIITMDADGQHDPSDIPSLLAAMRDEGAAYVIGRRRISGTAMPLHRRLSNTVTSFLVSARTGQHIPDSQCGFRVLSRVFARSVTVTSDGFEAETEWIIRGAGLGFRLASAPVATVYTSHPSHMTSVKTTMAFIRTLFREYDGQI